MRELNECDGGNCDGSMEVADGLDESDGGDRFIRQFNSIQFNLVEGRRINSSRE